ncbi:unnamed protein product [[Actinomadura] parvosata subsp. kistnae]|uniref:Uncharacterized protein n=1 Tax=[Actinomadura] parvosata subsp. kistnae TaxID=1909395 RepID=A0A1V0ACS3_9ACTN|nr:CU044_5270 family protein [Nonomuraea sp. ATCC 55076]AQZ67969.1 hypothetical protein BKM31_46750 [Nonomuraea sp. ATCC 55076]SPL93670.1 unnamed protein product [Actinomadura parvosata subsp. kistnae]
MTDRTFARLKPEGLDELAEDGYRRRRSGDLARAFATPRTEAAPLRRRRPYVLAAATLAAGLAAVAASVVVTGDPAPRPAPPSASSAAPTVVDARSFLLAAATTAKREPAESGRYWYLNERTLQKVHVAPGEYMAGLKELSARFEKKEKELKGDQERLEAAREEFEREVGELKRQELPYTAFAADTTESWRAMRPGETSRSVRGQDVKVTFGSAEDEAAWRAAGSPELVQPGAGPRDDATPRVLSIDNPSLTLQNVRELPTSKDELRRRLDELWKRSPNSADVGKAGYLWQTGVDLMTAPIRPGTRSALYQVLADQPGIASKGEVKDALGRTGVALSVSTADGADFRLVFDPGTAELLEYDVVDKGVTQLRVAVAGMGFTDKLGERP